jgi:hypothetical protein
VRFCPTALGSVSRSVSFSGGGGASRSVSGTGALTPPPAPTKVVNFAVTSPYGFQYTEGYRKCGFDLTYGVYGYSYNGATVGPVPAGAPFRWACVYVTASPVDVAYFGIRRRVNGETTNGTVVATIDPVWQSSQSYVDTTATSGTTSYEYGVFAVGTNGASSQTTWAGYGTNPGTWYVSSLSLGYQNCANQWQTLGDRQSVLYSCSDAQVRTRWLGSECYFREAAYVQNRLAVYLIAISNGIRQDFVDGEQTRTATGEFFLDRTYINSSDADHWRAFSYCTAASPETGEYSGVSLGEVRRFIVGTNVGSTDVRWGTPDFRFDEVLP